MRQSSMLSPRFAKAVPELSPLTTLAVCCSRTLLAKERRLASIAARVRGERVRGESCQHSKYRRTRERRAVRCKHAGAGWTKGCSCGREAAQVGTLDESCHMSPRSFSTLLPAKRHIVACCLRSTGVKLYPS
jgi:hypothetical protein